MHEIHFMVLYRPLAAKRNKSFLLTIKGQIDIPRYNCIAFVVCLGRTESCMQLFNYSFECIVFFFLLFVPCQAVIFGLLSRGKFPREKSTWTLDKVPPAGPGCQAGRILVDSMISHGNERAG